MDSFRFLSAAVSDRGLSEKRPENEDSYLQMAKCGIFAVADGVGGAQAGEVASQMAMEILAEAFTNLHDGADAETVMRTAIERANGAIYEMAHELPQLANMATTVVAVHLAGSIATIAHVGDSRLYRLDRNGDLYRETDDHSMVAEEVRAGRMTEEQAENHPSRNIINRALGAEPSVEVDLKTIMIEPGTAFLICSDGITRHVVDQEIKGVLTFGGDPREICEYLKDLCYGRGAEDNLTAVVVKVLGEAAEIEEPAGQYSAEIEEIEETEETEEPTIATVRSPFESKIPDDEEDMLLELETREMPKPELADETADDPEDVDDTIDALDPKPIVPAPKIAGGVRTDNSPMFSDAVLTAEAEAKSGSIGKMVSALGMLLLGSAIGFGVYHFTLVPVPADPATQQLSVMKSENIPFSSFEKNRRNVDADPVAYLRQVPAPEDAEGYYLSGRANILIGDFPKARLALIEAQKNLVNVDPANARILKTDIEMALVITNDPMVQNRLKLALNAGNGQLSTVAPTP